MDTQDDGDNDFKPDLMPTYRTDLDEIKAAKQAQESNENEDPGSANKEGTQTLVESANLEDIIKSVIETKEEEALAKEEAALRQGYEHLDELNTSTHEFN